MSKIAPFIICTCSKDTKAEIEQIVNGLGDVLNDRNPDVLPKDDFEEKHPDNRSFVVPPLPPLKEPPKKESDSVRESRQTLAEYEKAHGKPLAPVYRPGFPRVPNHVVCPEL